MLAIILGSALVAGMPATPTLPSIAASDFDAWYRAAEAKTLVIPPEVERRARAFRYVFVAGFRNEKIRGYFAQNTAELVRHGIPRKRIHVINPSSSRDDEANAAEVAGQVAEIAGEGPERLVIIAHSRGACDALRFALGHPEFVAERVEALFLVQGPFGGSEAAAHAVGLGTAMDRKMPWRARIVAHLAGKVIRATTKGPSRAVLGGLAPGPAWSRWEEQLALHPDAFARVGRRTFYITSEIEPDRLRLARRAIARYLKTYHGPSDGMVMVADQSVPGLGTVLATVEAGHADLTQRFPAARGQRRLRRALIDGILMGVGGGSACR
ncbi:hypothetical protein TA3x_000352 [Tundrisphaera sp. TA3]|uniref:hypothetical protein n=1 Tax=Tundrisphaera sp. TA3 TaxID=3435775 RepID=UPI003EBF937F